MTPQPPASSCHPVLTCLLVEDDTEDHRILLELLSDVVELGRQCRLVRATTLLDARTLLEAEPAAFSLILLDLTLPDSQGIDTFRSLHEVAGTIPIILLSNRGDEALAMQAVQEGAQDFLVKGHLRGEMLWRAMLYAIERKKLVVALQSALAQVKALRGLLPICSYCKKIRDDQGDWKPLEAYLHENADIELTHGICPECMVVLRESEAEKQTPKPAKKTARKSEPRRGRRS